MSILPLLLLVGVGHAQYAVSRGNDGGLQPIMTPSQRRRICAELCLSGLGGVPCGESCLDILPQGMPLQYPNTTRNTRSKARRDACTVLCTNQLGYPLCECDYSTQKIDTKFRINFVQICSYFCLKHGYKIYGCQPCQVYQNAQDQHGGSKDLFGFDSSPIERKRINWEEWCKIQCVSGNGRAACNCDIPPIPNDGRNAL